MTTDPLVPTREAGVLEYAPTQVAAWGDYNNDGAMDIYVSNMFSSAGNRIAFQQQFQKNADHKTRAEFQRHARGNTLLRNQLGDDSKFIDDSVVSGITLGRWAWGSKFIDLNNDGWQDLVVANGFVTEEDTGDL